MRVGSEAILLASAIAMRRLQLSGLNRCSQPGQITEGVEGFLFDCRRAEIGGKGDAKVGALRLEFTYKVDSRCAHALKLHNP